MRKQVYILSLWVGLVGSLLISGQKNTIANTNDQGGNSWYSLPENATEQDYLPKTVVVKVKSELKPYCVQDQISISSVQKYFTKITGIYTYYIFTTCTPYIINENIFVKAKIISKNLDKMKMHP